MHMRSAVLLAGLTAAAICRPVDPKTDADFRARVAAFRRALPAFLTQPSPPPAGLAVGMAAGGRWDGAECKRIGVAYDRVERNLSPNHARSTLLLVNGNGGGKRARWVKKVHGSQHSFEIEADFYRRVGTHQLMAGAVCWESSSPMTTAKDGIFLDDPDGNLYLIGDDSYYYYEYYVGSQEVEEHQASSNAKAKKVKNKSEKALLIEYVEGSQSGDRMYELGYRDTSPSQSASLGILKRFINQLIEIIDHIHRNGMVHGDIKPENILVAAADDQIKLIDFDLSAPATAPRMRSGTRSTISPEVAMVVGGPVNEATDWWSVGATVLMWTAAWRCGQMERGKSQRAEDRVCNYRPFQFVRQENRITVHAIPDELDIPKGIGRVLRALLEADPSKRRFVSRDDLEFLRKQLFSDDHLSKKVSDRDGDGDVAAHEPDLRLDVSSSISSSIVQSTTQRSSKPSSMHSVHEKTVCAAPRCDAEECIKDDQEPLFDRKYRKNAQLKSSH